MSNLNPFWSSSILVLKKSIQLLNISIRFSLTNIFSKSDLILCKYITSFAAYSSCFSERSFILIKDVCVALEKIMKSAKMGQTFHISTNEFISIKKLCLKIKKIFNSKSKLNFVKDRKGKDKAYKLSSSKLRKSLRWKETNNFDHNLHFTCNWYVSNFKKLSKLKLNYEHC